MLPTTCCASHPESVLKRVCAVRAEAEQESKQRKQESERVLVEIIQIFVLKKNKLLVSKQKR